MEVEYSKQNAAVVVVEDRGPLMEFVAFLHALVF